MVTGDKRTGQKKILFGGSRHYGQITDENGWITAQPSKKKNQKILENSTDIRSESYWHQINCHVECRQMTKGQVTTKYGVGLAGLSCN